MTEENSILNNYNECGTSKESNTSEDSIMSKENSNKTNSGDCVTSKESDIVSESLVCVMESNENEVLKLPSWQKRRKYKSSYIGFGFIPNKDEELERPQCIVCRKILGNGSLKPSVLKRHLQKLHAEIAGKPRSYFIRLLRQLKVRDLDETIVSDLGLNNDACEVDSDDEANDTTDDRDWDPVTEVKLSNESDGKVRSWKKRRKYHSSYIKFGFIPRLDKELEKPQCIVCGKILANDALRPSSLIRHLHTLHKELIEKPVEYFENLRDTIDLAELDYKRPQKIITVRPNEGTLIASYIVALRLAKAGKPFIIAEELILPCMKDVCSEIFDESAVARINSISLSKETVTRRVKELAEDIEDQLWEELKSSRYFSLYIDESTDITNKAFLLVYARYENNYRIKEDILCALEMSYRNSTVPGAVFDALNTYMMSHGLKWTHCVGVCTDGAAVMTGSHSDLVARIKEMSPSCRIVHCLIRRELLVTSKRSPELNNILSEAVKIVNYVKANAQNTRLFLLLCDNMEMIDQQFLMNTESRWLSRGKVLSRILEIRNELALYLMEKKPDWAQMISEPGWVVKLAYMGDIFAFLNKLNTSVNGKRSSVFHIYDKIYTFKKKLGIWEERVSRYNIDMFPTCASLIDDGAQEFYIHELAGLIVGHLRSLQGQFDNYFPETNDPRSGNEWVRNPFSAVNLIKTNLSALQEDKLIELSSDKGLEALFEGDIGETEFWMKLHPDYPVLSDYALRLLLLFSNTHMCEAGYLAFSSMMTTNRNRLNFQAPLRVALSNIEPRIQKLASNKQAQKSH